MFDNPVMIKEVLNLISFTKDAKATGIRLLATSPIAKNTINISQIYHKYTTKVLQNVILYHKNVTLYHKKE